MTKFIFNRLLPRYEDAQEEKPVEVKPGTPSETDDFNYKRDSSKSIDQIAKESQGRIRKQKEKKKEDTPVETPPVEEGQEETPAPEETPEKPQVDKQAEARREQETEKKQQDLASKAAKEASEEVAKEIKASFSSEIEKILNKDKDIQEKQKEADELISAWEKEGRLPKDYNEVIQETMRINEARLEKRLQEVEQKRTESETQKQQDAQKAQDAQVTEEKTKLDNFRKQITADLEDIYTAKFLPRPANIEEINNPNTIDEAAKETQKVLEFGARLNRERAEKGLPAVTSLNKIYFLHYKPTQEAAGKKNTDQPAGATAPVGGVGNQSSIPKSERAYVYARDHGKSFAQLKTEAIARARKALGM